MPADRPIPAVDLDSVRRRSGAPVVDILAPEPAPAPQDTLEALLPQLRPRSYTDAMADLLRRHAKAKRAKTMHEEQAKSLGRDVAAMLNELIEMAAEAGIGKDDWTALLDDDPRFQITPFEFRQIWPKYREDPETDAPYTREHVINALIEAGLSELIVESPDSQAYPAFVRDRVKTWRHRCGQTGVMADGAYVDYDGTPLVGDELDDPCADILALPRALRVVVEPAELLDLRYRRKDAPPKPAPTADG